MRHYDSTIWDICKFTFAAYTTLIAVAIGLYEYSIDQQVNLIPASIATLSVGVLVGIFMFCLTVRNRVYFVVVARYINEQRQLFFSRKPLGFKNASRMYTNPSQPPFFDWRSSQAWLSYIMAALNSVLLATLVFAARHGHDYRWFACALSFVILFAAQLLVEVCYLRSREDKSASSAVFGEG